MASASRARVEACRQLLKIETEGSFISLASGRIGAQWEGERSSALTKNEERTCKSLVAGTTRWKRKLDAIISGLSSRSTSELDPEVLTVLRLGVFELIMEGAPSHIVNDLVEVSKSVCQSRGASGLVNWTLRTVVRSQESDSLPSFDIVSLELSGRDLVRALGIKHSFPNWMVSRFISQFRREGAEAFLAASNSIPHYHIRVNKRDMTPEKLVNLIESTMGGQASVSSLLPDDFIVVRSGLQSILSSGLMEKGSISVQDVSCGLVVQLLDPQPGELILDCCSAPGGKAIFAAARMKGEGRIEALDVSSSKLRALQTAAERMGVGEMIEIQEARPLQAFKQEAVYDRVIVDAPCSGTGVLSKRADLRWRRTLEQMQELVGLQDELIACAAGLVKLGGVLVYSTCSVDREENEDRIKWFLSKHSDFEIDSKAALALLPSEVTTAEGYLKTLPHLHFGADGAFACRLRRIR
jgi:16S rRNA (cytosine967-C5)-methyltransferase